MKIRLVINEIFVVVVVVHIVVVVIVLHVAVVDPRNLHLKFGQSRVNNGLYVADIEFVWVMVVVGSVKSCLHVNPQFGLSCG